MEIYHEVDGALDLDAYDGMRQIITIGRDEFWSMGISLPSQSAALVKNNFHNVQKVHVVLDVVADTRTIEHLPVLHRLRDN